MNEELSFFARYGLMSDPGPNLDLLEGLPGDLAGLCRVVQGSTLHIFWAERYGVQLPEERQAEVQLRSMRRRLERARALDARPLCEPRTPETRLVGNCRDFSLLLATLLQSQGIPARPRCGFGRYFIPEHYEDHWVCEYWNSEQERWVLVDAQMDELQAGALGLPFDPLNVPRDQFIVAGKAWQMCRAGEADPETFGIADMHGLWFIRGNLLRDAASLNKMELLPWDCWGLAEPSEEAESQAGLALLDRVADLTYADVPEFAALQGLYEVDARLRVPDEIHSYTQAGMQAVRVRE